MAQIHPTRICNLECLHCYSASGPKVREALPADLIRSLLDDLVGEDFTVVSFSGGEPLMYEPLPEMLAAAKALGLLTAVTTNGMLLDQRRVDALAGMVDVLAISLDGNPQSHNTIRAHPRAFELMAGNLERVRRSGLRFGFIFTLTQYNLDELPFVLEFALEQGAALLQIHPLEAVGRAGERLAGAQPDDVEMSFAALAAAEAQAAVGDRLFVQLDLVNADMVRQQPERVYADVLGSGFDISGRSLGELVSPIVVEADGWVSPLQYGFPRCFGIGDLKTAGLGALAETWRAERHPAFRRICAAAFGELTDRSKCALPMFDWYERVSAHAEALSASASG